jgi:hypothetical protein
MSLRSLLDTPAPVLALEEWLGKLGLLCAGNMAAGDAMAKMGAYARMLTIPECLLTRNTLDAAGREFKWFPSYGELAEFFATHINDLKERQTRAHRIASVQLEPPRSVKSGGGRHASEMTATERAEFVEGVLARYRNASGLGGAA